MADGMSAREALEATQAARARLASAADCPPWRQAAFGGLMGGVVAAQAAPEGWPIVLEGLLAVAAGGLYVYDRARKGVWLNGYRAGATRKVTFAMLAAFFLIYAGAVYLKFSHGLWWAPLAGGAAMAGVGVLASRRWSRAYRAEVEGGL